MNNNNDKITVMIGIPTCYGGKSLVGTIKSIYRSKDTGGMQIVIVADRTPISESNRQILKQMGAKLIWNETQGSQFKKLKQLIAECNADIFIFTQDDITFNSNSISEIVKTFKDNPEITMVGSRILPLPAKTFFEKSMTSMVRIVDHISAFWNKGDNYLAASGRCLSFRTNTLKKFNIRENIVNGDMYLYLENKRVGGSFARSEKSVVYIRCPQSLKDQIGPSSRYQFSEIELTKFFPFRIKPEYTLPISAIALAVLNETFTHPLSALLYFFVFMYTRIKRQPYHTISPIWKIDESTKK